MMVVVGEVTMVVMVVVEVTVVVGVDDEGR